MAGFVSQATLEQIRAANDIVDVIGGYLPLKRAGANFVALCPFHREKTPSFSVNPHRQIFHCFGCHKGGDVFTFVKEFEILRLSLGSLTFSRGPPRSQTIPRTCARHTVPVGCALHSIQRSRGWGSKKPMKRARRSR